MNISLLEETKCNKFIHATEVSPKINELVAEKKDLQTFAVKSLDDMLQGHNRCYPYEVTYAEARKDPVLILHSSGSTGTVFLHQGDFTRNTNTMNIGPPKPVISNHATWAVVDNDRNLRTIKGRRNQNYALFNFPGDGGRYFAAFPPFHVSFTVFE